MIVKNCNVELLEKINIMCVIYKEDMHIVYNKANNKANKCYINEAKEKLSLKVKVDKVNIVHRRQRRESNV